MNPGIKNIQNKKGINSVKDGIRKQSATSQSKSEPKGREAIYTIY